MIGQALQLGDCGAPPSSLQEGRHDTALDEVRPFEIATSKSDPSVPVCFQVIKHVVFRCAECGYAADLALFRSSVQAGASLATNVAFQRRSGRLVRNDHRTWPRRRVLGDAQYGQLSHPSGRELAIDDRSLRPADQRRADRRKHGDAAFAYICIVGHSQSYRVGTTSSLVPIGHFRAEIDDVYGHLVRRQYRGIRRLRRRKLASLDAP